MRTDCTVLAARSVAETRFVRRVRQLRREANAKGWTAGRLGEDADFRRHHRIFHVVRRRPGDIQFVRQRRGHPFLDRQPVVDAAIDLQFGDRTEPDAQADCWNAPQIAFEPRHRVLLIARNVDAGLNEQAPGANRLRIFGDERTLLRERASSTQHTDEYGADESQ
jgi:hypothetical protein